MGYFSANTFRIHGMEKEEIETVIQMVKEYFDVDVTPLNIGSEKGPWYFETDNYWNHNDWEFFRTLSKAYPDVIFVIDRETEDNVYVEVRFKQGDYEAQNGRVRYSPFTMILIPEEKKQKTRMLTVSYLSAFLVICMWAGMFLGISLGDKKMSITFAILSGVFALVNLLTERYLSKLEKE